MDIDFGAAIESLWLIAASVTLVLNIQWLRVVRRQQEALLQLPDGSDGERILAAALVRNEWLRSAAQALLFLGALVAVLMPRPPLAVWDEFHATEQAFTALACTGICVLSSLVSVLTMRDYRRVLESHGVGLL